jgi:hypothetical protein
MPHIQGLLRRTPHKKHFAVYCDAPVRGRSGELGGKREGGDELVMEIVWQQVGVLLSSGAIGSLLVWGYQNWLKK